MELIKALKADMEKTIKLTTKIELSYMTSTL